MKLQKADAEALENSSRLLKYVAEHRKQAELPEEVVASITHAWELSENKQWDANAAKEFWIKYSALCDLAQPATIDTIDANTAIVAGRRSLFFGWGGGMSVMPDAGGVRKTAPVPGSDAEAETTTEEPNKDGLEVTPPVERDHMRFGSKLKRSLSRRFAQRCMTALVILLVLVVTLGYIASSADALSREVRGLMADGDKAVSQVRADIDGVASDIARLLSDEKAKGSFDSTKSTLDQDLINTVLPADTMLKVTQLREHLQAMYYYVDTMFQKIQAVSAILPLVPAFPEYNKGDLTPVPNLRDALANVTAYYLNRRDINERLQQAWIWIALYNAVVPMFLGALGASTYVVRLISDQIRETTFSTTSPIRHVMRISLGALAGVIIGFGGIVTGTGLSSAALAFIAGYAVEPVFSTLDGIAEKFRDSRKPAA